jgi:hypothetical protein
VLSLICIILFPFLIWRASKTISIARKSSGWPTVAGVVTAAERVKVTWRAQPRITFSYAVNGAPYSANRLSFAPVPPRETDAILGRYPVNQAVTVHHSPDDPAEAVLEAGATPNVTAQRRSLVIMFVMVLLANGAYFGVKMLQPAAPRHRTYDDVIAADPKVGDRLIRANAEKGNAQDQFYVGNWYMMGHDVAKDPAEAVKWFRKSADQGYAEAQACLGELYATGNGVAKDMDAAIALFRKAAAQQNERAQFDLGFSYEKGFGVPQDLQQAGEWYAKAKSDPRTAAAVKRLAAIKP